MIINVLGDSITEGALASSEDKTFVYVLANLLNCKVNNYGISGSRIARQHVPSENPRYDLFFGSRVKDLVPSDFIIVFGGTNDYGHGDAPIGDILDETPDTFYGGMNYLIDELLKRYDRKEILFMLPLYRFNEDDPLGDHVRENATLSLQGYRDCMIEVLNNRNIKYIDIKDIFGKPETCDLFGDGLHPNDKGHKLIAELLAGYIKSL